MSGAEGEGAGSGAKSPAFARAEALYAGVVTPHRSCGIAVAETLGLPTAPYQCLRKGGLTGMGPCGAIQAGVLALGEILGDPSPSGAVTPALAAAIPRFREKIAARVDHGVDASCNTRVGHHTDFMGPARKGYCTRLAAVSAEAAAEVLAELGVERPLPPAPWEP